MDETRSAEPLDPKLTRWLQDEVARRLLPPHWEPEILKLISWATTYQDGKALHALILSYPRRIPIAAAVRTEEPPLPAPETGPRQRSLKQAPRHP